MYSGRMGSDKIVTVGYRLAGGGWAVDHPAVVAVGQPHSLSEGRAKVRLLSGGEGGDDTTEDALPAGSGLVGYCGEWVVAAFVDDLEDAANVDEAPTQSPHDRLTKSRGVFRRIDGHISGEFTAVFACERRRWSGGSEILLAVFLVGPRPGRLPFTWLLRVRQARPSESAAWVSLAQYRLAPQVPRCSVERAVRSLSWEMTRGRVGQTTVLFWWVRASVGGQWRRLDGGRRQEGGHRRGRRPAAWSICGCHFEGGRAFRNLAVQCHHPVPNPLSRKSFYDAHEEGSFDIPEVELVDVSVGAGLALNKGQRGSRPALDRAEYLALFIGTSSA